jgi:hypothetical protein
MANTATLHQLHVRLISTITEEVEDTMQDICTCFYRSYGLGTQFSASTDSGPLSLTDGGGVRAIGYGQGVQFN